MSLKQDDTILTDTPLAPISGAVYSGGVPGESKVIAVDANGVLQTSGGGGGTVNQGSPASTADRWPVQITDGTDLALVTAAGEVNVIATAQPGVDIGDVTVNNGAGAAAVNIQDGGNSITVDGSVTASGTVTANQGTPNSTANRWPVQITDGTDLALVTASGELNTIVSQITTSVVPGTGASHLGKSNNGNSETGVAILGTKSPSSNTYHCPSIDDFNGDGTNQLKVNLDGSTVLTSGVITAVVPGTGATNLGKAEDSAHATGHVGVMALAVRNDADTALAGATGDYIPIGTDAVGRVQVNSIGKLAHDAVDTAANSPQKVGGAAVTNNDALTSVASGDMSNFSTDRKSRHIVDSDRWQVASATNATTTDAALIAAPGAGSKLQVYGLFVCLTCPVQVLNVIKDEGIRFRFASGTYHFNVVKTVHHVHTILNAPDSVAFPLEPTMIDLQHGHWDGGDNEALNFSLMGLSGAALGTAYVTAYYRVMPT